MKKLVTLFLSLAIATVTFGKSVTVEKAGQVANTYFAQISGKSVVSVASSFSKSYNGITTYHVFNFSGGGFVVVSADDVATPILAFSKEGYVETEISNPATRDWFESYNKEIAHLVATDASNTGSLSEWEAILNNETDASTLVVDPLTSTLWDQGQWYNYYCPTAAGGPGGKAWAGCVATTMGQIMKFWSFPATGVGSHSYYHAVYGQQSANFGATSYNFANMGTSATSGSYQQIATLLYHAGVAVEMDYSPDGSGAFSTDVPWTMSTYFNYDNKTIALANKTSYTTTTWKELLKSELNAGRPLYYSGSGTAGGHAWVCDGYNSADKFHMNWGWSGVSNGYYSIGALNTGNGSFNSSNAVVLGIKPGNPDLIVRFEGLREFNLLPYGQVVNLNCKVWAGTPDAINLYIDNNLVHSTTNLEFTYPWNTASEVLGTHVAKVEAIHNSDTVYHIVNLSLSEWIEQASGFTTASRGITYMHAVDSNVVWAIAYDGSGSSAYTNDFTKTSNGGTTWTPNDVLGGATYGLGNICGLNENIAYVALYNGVGNQDNTCGVYKTSNGGSTWTHLTGALQGSSSFADNVWFWNENQGMCHGDVKDNYFEIYTTNNGGTTWTRVPKSNIGGGANPVSGEGGWTGVMQAVGDSTIMFGTNKANLYVSYDRGNNWVIRNTGITPISDGVNEISFKDKMNGLVVQTKTDVVIRETHDGGLTWATVTPTGAFLTNDIVYVPGTDNTFVSTGAATGATGASYSFDGGHTWSMFMGTENTQFLACAFANNHCGWAGGFNTSSAEGGMNKYVGTLDPAAMLVPVSNLVVNAVESTVNISWTEPVTPPLSYNIYRNDTLLTNTNNPVYQDLAVANGPQLYCIAAVYDLGESPRVCATAWVTTNIEHNDEAAVKVFPVPATEMINVVTPVKAKEIRMLNNLGNIVYSNVPASNHLKILTEGFAPGMYIIQINTGKKLISRKVSISK